MVVTFVSEASNLVPNDTNGAGDAFVRDLASGTTTRVSVAADGSELTGINVNAPVVSGNGRFVAFVTYDAAVPGDDNGGADVYVRDLREGATELVSTDATGRPATGVTPSLSWDGRYVAFESGTRIVPHQSLAQADVYVRDRVSGKTHLISVASNGTPANDYSGSASISGDGSCVAFYSVATNLDPRYPPPNIYVHDIRGGGTRAVSVSTEGQPPNGSSFGTDISLDGRRVIFGSNATNLTPKHDQITPDVFLHDVPSRVTELVSIHTGPRAEGFFPSTNGDGSRVAFTWYDWVVPEEVPPGRLVVRDLQTGSVHFADSGSADAVPNGYVDHASISGDGRRVAFHANATNLLPGDSNGVEDVYVRTLPVGTRRIPTEGSGCGAVSAGLPGIPAHCLGLPVTLVGSRGRDVIVGTPRRDVVVALGGPDRVSALQGNDRVCGGRGRDVLLGGGGVDRLRGGRGADRLLGGARGDLLVGDGGLDRCYGGPGRERAVQCEVPR
jgi:Tol biopolymer transport system component